MAVDVRERLREIASGKGTGPHAPERLVQVAWPVQRQIERLLDRRAALPRPQQSNRVIAP